jgi:formylglycine-generating enzyme required for sulfatase activity
VARIFLCHASEDKAQVREVYHRLRAIDGFEPWLDEEDLLPSQEWDYEIKRALKSSDFILIFLSRNSVAKRGYVQREMKLALDAWQELPEGTIHTIPVRIDDCDAPESFRRYHWANLFEPNGFDRLVRVIRVELDKRQAPTPTSRPSNLQDSPSISLSEASATTDNPLDPTFTNSIGMEFVLIPAGTFTMGSPEGDTQASDDEKPAHHVTIGQPFYLAKYPVTRAQWEAVVNNNPRYRKERWNRPVASVSWDEAQSFLDKLNERELGKDYRLPTEAQWEYACRAGTWTPWYHPDINAIALYSKNFDPLLPVGQKLPNAWGLYDMLGHVREWCHDGKRLYTADTTVDPIGPTDAGAHRIIRGGSWHDTASRVRAAYRNWVHPNIRHSYLGFRCACSGSRR